MTVTPGSAADPDGGGGRVNDGWMPWPLLPGWWRRCACGHLWMLHRGEDLPTEPPGCRAPACRGGCELPPAGVVLP